MRIFKYTSKWHTHALEFSYHPILVEKARSLKNEVSWKNFSFDPDTKYWVFSYEHIEQVKTYFPDAQLEEGLNDTFAQDEPLNIDSIKVEDLPLFPYQEEGVGFIVSQIDSGGVLIADEMGLGKSIQALAYLKHSQNFPCLIVCPASLQNNWRSEIKRWLKRDCQILDKNSRAISDIDVCSYNFVGKVRGNYQHPYKLIIFDESHYLKNPKALRTKAALKFLEGECKRILLTGTPILNKPAELAAQIMALNRMESFGTYYSFLHKYCQPEKTKWGTTYNGATNMHDLKQRIKPFALRRTKLQVLKDLPDKIVNPVTIGLPEPLAYEAVKMQGKAEYESLMNDLRMQYAQAYSQDELTKALTLDEITQGKDARQIRAVHLKVVQMLRAECARQKLLIVPEMLETYVENKKKVIVFTCHVDIANQLNAKFPNCSAVITGQVPVKDRQQIVEQFQEDPDLIFLFATIKTAGVGFTLTAASDVIFTELDWTPANHQQAEDRAYRIGQKNNVNVQYLIFENSIEENIAGKLLSKSKTIESAIQGEIMKATFKEVVQTLIEKGDQL